MTQSLDESVHVNTPTPALKAYIHVVSGARTLPPMDDCIGFYVCGDLKEEMSPNASDTIRMWLVEVGVTLS